MALTTKRQRWMLLAAGASAAATPLAATFVSRGWKLAMREEPPDDPVGPDVDWPRTVAWTAATAVAVALAQLAARHGAAVAWERFTGERPPRPRSRPRLRRMRRR